MFSVKVPLRVPCVLDEAVCPLSTAHNICDYPDYYNALYYPHYHTAIFATAGMFCAWLLKCIVSHHGSCFLCPLTFTGSFLLMALLS
ncbi:hypothetical protein F4604DRAFT_1805997 [Suillus subluteus]|nr:hypothetical protein F4604DRAFT_1805997 [Suillus subluteus]